MTIELATYIMWSLMLVFTLWMITIVAKDANYKDGYRDGYRDGIDLKATSFLKDANGKQKGRGKWKTGR